MDDFKAELVKIDSLLDQLDGLTHDLRPQKGQLRWFAERKSKLARGRVHISTRDALNHAAALIGYFEGYEARGKFQLRTKALSDAMSVTNLLELLDYLQWVISEIRVVIRELIQREPLKMCEVGPKKPGPDRTAEVCLGHLNSLMRVFCVLFQNVSACDDMKQTIQRYLAAVE